MDARTFLKQTPEADVTRIAEAAGTNLAYFKQLAYGARIPRPKLAEALEKASDGQLTRMELLYPPPTAEQADAR